MVNILDPMYIIAEVFGSIYLFAAIMALIFIYFTAKYRWNLQLTFFGILLLFMIALTIDVGFTEWFPFMIVIIGMILAYIFWRYWKTT